MNETRHGTATIMSDGPGSSVTIIFQEERPTKPFTRLTLSEADYLELRVAMLKHKL